MTYRDIERQLQVLLSEKRYNHSLGVAKSAARLAEIYGVDEKKAYLAGLVHDCAKGLKPSWQLILALQATSGFDLTQITYPALYHGPAGSVYAERHFSINEKDILKAVSLHILGDRNMSNLEKIIFIADYIEENRKFSWREEIERVAFHDIDRAMVLGCDVSINYLLSAGKKVHPKMIRTRNYYSGKYKEEES